MHSIMVMNVKDLLKLQKAAICKDAQLIVNGMLG
jgi:hypothetical protein